jgi:hypothetical protein
MMKLERSPGTYAIACDEFLMQFVYRDDRWQHRLSVRSPAGADCLLLTSVEGTPDDPLPPSPAFQDLFIEQPADQICEVQLMGQAGRQIYSGGIRIDGRQSLLDFDLCLVSKLPPGQGPPPHSRYELAAGCTATIVEGPQTVCLQAGGECWSLAPHLSEEYTGLTLHLAETGCQRPPEVSLQGVITGNPGPLSGGRRNQRWRYTLRRGERA